MARSIRPDEARRVCLAEWRAWAEKQIPDDQPRTGAHAAQFFKFLETDRAAVLRTFGSAVDAEVVHGWLFRNGEVAD